MNTEKKYLKYLPRLRDKVEAVETDNGMITLHFHRNTWYEKLLTFIFNSPRVLKYDLDEMGSIVVKNIDGRNNISDIIFKLEQVTDEKEQLTDRTLAFISMLHKSGMVLLSEK
ncbi:MAG: PqqD family peptide modification chaperone [bacterium]